MQNALREAEQEITYVIEDQEKFLNWLEDKFKQAGSTEEEIIYCEIIEKFKEIMI